MNKANSPDFTGETVIPILAKEDVLTVSRALELALFMDAKLDVSRIEAS